MSAKKISPKSPKPRKRPASFDGLTERQLGALYNMAAIKHLTRGQKLIKEGDLGREFFVIIDGLISVVKHYQGVRDEIAVLGEGDWVGEIAFTHEVTRTATAIAKTPSTVMAIDKPTLETLDESTQLFFYQRLNDLAAERIDDLSNRESDLSKKNTRLMDYIRNARGRERMDYEQSEMIRGIIGKVPRLPAFAAQLTAKLLSDDASASEITELVKEDPSMAAMILKTVNSPYYGFKHKIADIHHAVLLLGFNEIFQLVLADGVRRTMPDSHVFKEMHFHSVIISHLCHVISQESRVGRPAEAATIGLLHELGRSVVQMLKDRNPNLAMLIDSLDSAQLGGMLLKSWDLPEAIHQTVEFHQYPDFSPPSTVLEPVRPNVAVLYAAHLCYGMLNSNGMRDMQTAFLDDYIDLLGWKSDGLDGLLSKRVLPTLVKRINTYPAKFRALIRMKSEPKKSFNLGKY